MITEVVITISKNLNTSKNQQQIGIKQDKFKFSNRQYLKIS